MLSVGVVRSLLVLVLIVPDQLFPVVAQADSEAVTSADSSKRSLPKSRKKPNFVVLLVDDLGIADVGCFGNDTIKTPNVDRLAAMGAKLTHSLAPAPICTPSRAATLTGRYAIRSGMTSGPGDAPVLVNLGAPGGLPSNETTFPKVLQKNGYKTGIIGKWHLGLNCNSRNDGCHNPLNFGFDEFYGLPLTNLRDCDTREGGIVAPAFFPKSSIYSLFLPTVILMLVLAYTGILSKRSACLLAAIAITIVFALPTITQIVVTRFVCVLMRGFDVVEQPIVLENLTVRFTNEAKYFISNHKQGPFLLFMSYAKVHTALFSSPKFKGHSVHGFYGDNVEEMDWSVGEIIRKLEEENILNDTLVYFTSDHGPHLEEVMPSGEYHGGWKGQYRGGKGQTWEGGIRVPTVAMWKDHIPSGVVISEPTNTMDIFTTMIELAGASVPTDRAIDGKNIMPLLTIKQLISPHEFMFHYCGTAIHAVRYRPRTGNVTWKAHFVTAKWDSGKEECLADTVCRCFGDKVNYHDPPLLYDITNDPYERNPLALSIAERQQVISKMKEAVKFHQLEVKPVQSQLGYPNGWWSPRLQPCCNFPFCSCSESAKET